MKKAKAMAWAEDHAVKECKDSDDFHAKVSEASLVAYDFSFRSCKSLAKRLFLDINANLLVEDDETEDDKVEEAQAMNRVDASTIVSITTKHVPLTKAIALTKAATTPTKSKVPAKATTELAAN